jgi:hypothetical protein
MTREEFIAEMRVRGWSEDDIHESLMAHDEMETERGQALSFELFLVDNLTPSIREYRIREEGGWEDVVQAS